MRTIFLPSENALDIAGRERLSFVCRMFGEPRPVLVAPIVPVHDSPGTWRCVTLRHGGGRGPRFCCELLRASAFDSTEDVRPTGDPIDLEAGVDGSVCGPARLRLFAAAVLAAAFRVTVDCTEPASMRQPEPWRLQARIATGTLLMGTNHTDTTIDLGGITLIRLAPTEVRCPRWTDAGGYLEGLVRRDRACDLTPDCRRAAGHGGDCTGASDAL